MTSHTREGKGLTVRQHHVLELLANSRWARDCDDDNNSGWVPALGIYPRSTVRALQRLGMIEAKHKDFAGPTSGQWHRITAAGRLALSQSLDAGEEG